MTNKVASMIYLIRKNLKDRRNVGIKIVRRGYSPFCIKNYKICTNLFSKFASLLTLFSAALAFARGQGQLAYFYEQ